MRQQVIVLTFAVLLISSLQLAVFANATNQISQNQPSLTLEPSSVVIKVGDTATISAVLVNGQNTTFSQVCFEIEGFPATGFITSITPECTALQPFETMTASLNVTATPAAAPQNVTALIVASGGTLAVQAFLLVTVVPAIPAWIPWSMIAVFIAILGLSLFYGNKRKRRRRK
ncbi:MAG: hypothetical protein ACLPY5_08475 [Candidatus Bathyarchaeia archaeon]